MKRIFSFFLVAFVLIQLPWTAFAGNFKTEEEIKKLLENALGDVMSVTESDFVMEYMMYQGSLKLAKFYIYEGVDATGNTTSYPAYCMDLDKPGASVKPHLVDTSVALSNPKMWGILSNGYPYLSPAELGYK